ncbi:hypothetical protein BC834DRAFT_848092 [Gloeopeniophorella convolvens]|nr:hypothetical protein BC834DRAFT_848092 [Gloeopeniophorella convolvens]
MPGSSPQSQLCIYLAFMRLPPAPSPLLHLPLLPPTPLPVQHALLVLSQSIVAVPQRQHGTAATKATRSNGASSGFPLCHKQNSWRRCGRVVLVQNEAVRRILRRGCRDESGHGHGSWRTAAGFVNGPAQQRQSLHQAHVAASRHGCATQLNLLRQRVDVVVDSTGLYDMDRVCMSSCEALVWEWLADGSEFMDEGSVETGAMR